MLKYVSLGCLALAMTACTASTSLPDVNVAAISGDPGVSILSPKEGDHVSGSSVHVKLAPVGKVTIIPAAQATNKHLYGEGHFHLFLDVQPTAAGEAIPAPTAALPGGGRIIHTASTDVTIDNVPTGHHVLFAILGYSDHIPYQATCHPGTKGCLNKVEFDVTGGAAAPTPSASAEPSPAASASAAPSPAASAPAGGPPAIKIKLVTDNSVGGAYDPKTASVKVGDTVEWDWVDTQQPHTVTAEDGTFDSGNPESAGATFKYTFTKAGTYDYKCNIHPQMKGTITVT